MSRRKQQSDDEEYNPQESSSSSSEQRASSNSSEQQASSKSESEQESEEQEGSDEDVIMEDVEIPDDHEQHSYNHSDSAVNQIDAAMERMSPDPETRLYVEKVCRTAIAEGIRDYRTKSERQADMLIQMVINRQNQDRQIAIDLQKIDEDNQDRQMANEDGQNNDEDQRDENGGMIDEILDDIEEQEELPEPNHLKRSRHDNDGPVVLDLVDSDLEEKSPLKKASKTRSAPVRKANIPKTKKKERSKRKAKKKELSKGKAKKTRSRPAIEHDDEHNSDDKEKQNHDEKEEHNSDEKDEHNHDEEEDQNDEDEKGDGESNRKEPIVIGRRPKRAAAMSLRDAFKILLDGRVEEFLDTWIVRQKMARAFDLLKGEFNSGHNQAKITSLWILFFRGKLHVRSLGRYRVKGRCLACNKSRALKYVFHEKVDDHTNDYYKKLDDEDDGDGFLGIMGTDCYDVKFKQLMTLANICWELTDEIDSLNDFEFEGVFNRKTGQVLMRIETSGHSMKSRYKSGFRDHDDDE